MSNLSDIGFPVRGDEDINEMIETVARHVAEIACPNGFYYKFTDESGAEIYLQTNLGQELIGFNPHFDGKSRRRVGLTKSIERESSELDGGFYGWANPAENDLESGDYPFVFDAPDFRTVGRIKFPQAFAVQLTAFASNDFQIYENERAFYDAQEAEPKFAAQSFIPSGLFAPNENAEPSASPRPFGIFAGTIKEFALKTNQLTNAQFYWFLVETLGGETDVVADAKLIETEPQIGGIVRGQFWLSGKIIDPPAFQPTRSRFLKVLNQ